MSIIVTDKGFKLLLGKEQEFVGIETLFQGVESPINLDLPNDQDPRVIQPCFCWIKIIRIPFPNFSDGRGFSLAARLRQLGYEGILRAQGHIIADQYNLARQSGFDEIEIDEMLAKRQPESHWLKQAQKRTLSYQKRLLKVA
ncbi:MAG: DUF934 domain-containing protein [Rhodobacteraceae bacterium]|nr:DUF934 domain-containing protein [Paracoccaceae bacterium]